jgi:hypothetical protein
VHPSKLSHSAPFQKHADLVTKRTIGVVQQAEVSLPAFIVVQDAFIKKAITRKALDNHKQIDLFRRKRIASADSFMGPQKPASPKLQQDFPQEGAGNAFAL